MTLVLNSQGSEYLLFLVLECRALMRPGGVSEIKDLRIRSDLLLTYSRLVVVIAHMF
jgi:hypothetical protein